MKELIFKVFLKTASAKLRISHHMGVHASEGITPDLHNIAFFIDVRPGGSQQCLRI